MDKLQKYNDESSDVLERAYFYAMGIESRPLEMRLEDAITETWGDIFLSFGRLNGAHSVIVRTQVGKRKALKAAKTVIKRLAPQCVYSVGFAGALNPELKRFQICDNLIPMNFRPDNIIDVAPTSPEEIVNKNYVIYTSEKIVVKREEKRDLYQKYRADLVDMETDAVAEVCNEFNVPLICTRIVSDTADEDIPPDIERILSNKSAAGRFGAALGSIFRKPARIFDLIKLQANANQAAQALAQYLMER